MEPNLGKQPLAILSFDEALLTNPKICAADERLVGLQRAMRYQRKNLTGSPEKKGLFGLLLDTAPKVSRCSCSEDVDKGYLDCPEVYGLFPPIFRIDSMNAFAKDNKKGWKALRQVSELLESKTTQNTFTISAGRSGAHRHRISRLQHEGKYSTSQSSETKVTIHKGP